MSNGNRTLFSVIVLIVGLGVGFLIGRGTTPGPLPLPTPTPTPVPTALATPPPTPTCPPGTSQSWKLFVGPGACDVVDEKGNAVPYAFVSATNGNSIEFHPKGGKSLDILIHAPVQLFRDVAPHGHDPQGQPLWRVYCDDFQQKCSTGPALVGNEYYGCYKYDQVLDGNLCDGHIIIQP